MLFRSVAYGVQCTLCTGYYMLRTGYSVRCVRGTTCCVRGTCSVRGTVYGVLHIAYGVQCTLCRGYTLYIRGTVYGVHSRGYIEATMPRYFGSLRRVDGYPGWRGSGVRGRRVPRLAGRYRVDGVDGYPGWRGSGVRGRRVPRLAGRYCVVESVSGGSGGARVGFLKVTFYPPYKRDFRKQGYPPFRPID